MAQKFDLYEELKANGFEEGKNEYGYDVLKKTYSKDVEVLWYGMMKFDLTVEALFNQDHSVLTAYYYDGAKCPYKTKTHLNDRRALNAIRQTVEHKEFAF